MRHLTMTLLAMTATILSTGETYAVIGDQVLKLLPEDGEAGDDFGISVAISGNTAIIGAFADDDNGDFSGSAYLFDITTGQQLFKLLPEDGSVEDFFGGSVAINGDIALVGVGLDDDNGEQSGSVYIFDTATGVLIDKLFPTDAEAGDAFGRSVAISGTTAIIGAIGDDDNGEFSGSAYLFDITTGQQLFKLLPNDGAEQDLFGWYVDISGTTAIVGAFKDDDNGDFSGSAYLFDTTTGLQIAKLLPEDGEAEDEFGISVAIDGNIAIVGAWFNDDVCPGLQNCKSGSAYIFDATTGQQLFKLLPNDIAQHDLFGSTVDISGTIAIIGAAQDDDNSVNSGSAYLFDTTTGIQIDKLVPTDGAAHDGFGGSVAINCENNTALIGSPHDDDNGAGSGSAYVFQTDRANLILFREADDAAWGLANDGIPGWDHVAIAANGTVYEAHPGYASGMPCPDDPDPDLSSYWDPLTCPASITCVLMQEGVQNEHTVGAFLHDKSTEKTNAVSEAIPLDAELIEAMGAFIESQIGTPFLNLCLDPTDIQCWIDELNPDIQKGYIKGEQGHIVYSSVGIIERAAEEAGVNDGQGFVLNQFESFSVPGLGVVPTLSPMTFYNAMLQQQVYNDADSSIMGYLDPVDFVITDPIGRRLGYTAELGELDEIPDSFFTGDGDVEQFIILDPIAGEYQVQLVGVGEPVNAAFGGSIPGEFFQGFLDVGETHDLFFVLIDPCPWDLNDDNNVSTFDLIALFEQWGTDGPADFDQSGFVNIVDILILFANWGPCP